MNRVERASALRALAARVADGTARSGRALRGLGSAAFAADERRPEDWVVLLARWAEHLRHVDAHDRLAGRWSALLEVDEALLLARVASAWGAQAPGAPDDEALEAAPPEALAEEVLRLAALLERWHRRLERTPGAGATALAATIAQLAALRLGPPLRAVQAAWGGAGRRLQARSALLGPLWTGPLGERVVPAADDAALRRALSAFRSALERLRERAATELAGSLQSPAHEPAAALLLAFLPLLGTVQRELARFGDRMVDFHVDEVLRLRPRPARPERLHLVLQPAPLAAPGEVAAGTAFVAGKDAAGRPLRFVATATLPLDDTAVAALATLRLERDPLISPEAEFGYACRARRRWLPVPGPGEPAEAWPLFGGSEQPAPAADEPAGFGLAIGSPALRATEGDRRLTVTLRLAHAATSDARLQQQAAELGAAPSLPGLAALCHDYLALERGAPDPGLDVPALAERIAAALQGGAVAPSPLDFYRAFLLQRALLASPPHFAHAAGRLFIHWLLAPVAGGGADWLTPAAHADLRAAAVRALGPRTLDDAQAAADPLALLFGARPPSRTLVFAHLFTGLLAVRYSGPGGWCDAPEAHVVRPRDGDRPGGAALQLVLHLAPEAPPLVDADPALHGADWPAGLPVLQLRLRPFGGLYPYSMLEGARLLEVGLALAVRGVRTLELRNPVGRLDPAQPFQPFGPLPAQGAWMVLGAPELGGKALTRLALQLRWAGLPTDAAGFAAHYAGHPQALDNRSFRAVPEVLREGRWVGGPEAGLFASDSAVSALRPDVRIDFDPALLRQHHRARRGPWPADRPAWDLGAQQGFLRLRLAGPEGAFGHAAHAALLTSSIAANLKRRRPQPLPRAPYTPLLEGLSLSYRAETRLHLDGEAPEGARLWHLHPFGTEPVWPAGRGGSVRLLPAVAHDGLLHIGLRAGRRPPRVALLFRLRDEAAVPRRGPPPRLHWLALCGDRWVPLAPAQVVQDGTAGLLTTGIVVLDLPEALDTEHRVMPAGLYWLALGADGGFDGFAALQSVHAQALEVVREGGDGTPLPPLRALVPARPLPGLDAVHLAGAPFGGRAAETAAERQVRAGERLRHRQRASQPWDVERLVLEAFPEVALAKCFGAGELPGPPGRVLVAVVPGPERFDRAAGRPAPRLNAIELQRIAAHLQALGSPHARFEVRNAAYERVQLRCALRLAPQAPVGATLQRAERALYEHLCPWVEGGLPPRFGWVLRQETVEACLRAVPGVAGVAALAMLHVVRDDDGFHTLGDTAAATAPAPGGVWRVELRPALPWSIVVPMERHELRVLEAGGDPQPVEAGVGDLGIGRTFIVGGAAHG